MSKICVGLVGFLFLAAFAFADAKKEQGRVENSGRVIKEILGVPDNVPQDLLDKAKCVVVLPSVVKFAIGIGGSYGRGVMTCRTGENFNGPWGAPSIIALEGGSFGLQLGPGHGLCSASHESPQCGGCFEQQGKTGCGCLCRGRPQGP